MFDQTTTIQNSNKARRCQSPPPTVSKPRLFDHVRMRSAHAPATASATTAHATAATGEIKGAPGWG